MKIEINGPDIRNFIKDIQKKPAKFFQMVRYDVRKSVGRYLTELMKEELTEFLGREQLYGSSFKKEELHEPQLAGRG